LPGSYAGMFALTDQDCSAGKVILATGETLTTRASRAHICGEESCRALLTLGVKTPAVRHALKAATENFVEFLAGRQTEKPTDGYYCCGKCSVSMWRNVMAGGMNLSETMARQHLQNGVARLKTCRQKDGRWRVFPFYYTLLALTEMPGKIAHAELAHAAPACQRALKRKPQNDLTDQVRRAIMIRVIHKA